MKNCTQSTEQVNTQQRRERERLAATRGARGEDPGQVARTSDPALRRVAVIKGEFSISRPSRELQVHPSLCACVCSLHLLAVPFLPSIFFLLPSRDDLGSQARRKLQVESMMIEKDRYFEK